jgi:hypothetical protein
VNIPDDIYAAVRSVAQQKAIPIGEAIAELVRRGLQPVARISVATAFPTFSLPDGAPAITLDTTLRAQDEL